jgi:hypothetical protein
MLLQNTFLLVTSGGLTSTLQYKKHHTHTNRHKATLLNCGTVAGQKDGRQIQHTSAGTRKVDGGQLLPLVVLRIILLEDFQVLVAIVAAHRGQPVAKYANSDRVAANAERGDHCPGVGLRAVTLDGFCARHGWIVDWMIVAAQRVHEAVQDRDTDAASTPVHLGAQRPLVGVRVIGFNAVERPTMRKSN